MVTDTYGDKTFGDRNKNCNLESFKVKESIQQLGDIITFYWRNFHLPVQYFSFSICKDFELCYKRHTKLSKTFFFLQKATLLITIREISINYLTTRRHLTLSVPKSANTLEAPPANRHQEHLPELP